MKVNRPEIISLINKIYRQETLRGREKTSAGAGEAKTVDRLEFSAEMEALKKELARVEDVDAGRAEKVARLQSQIEKGDYKVDSRELADILLGIIDQGRRF